MKNFRSRGFAQQITILQTIENEHLVETIDDLFSLLLDPLTDHSVDFMIEQTLRTLLPDREDKIVTGLVSDSVSLVKLCLQVACEHTIPAAADTLYALAQRNTWPHLLFDILSALARINNPGHRDLFERHATHSNALIAALCIDMVESRQDDATLDLLCSIITTAANDGHRRMCSLATVRALEALGRMQGTPAIVFLCKQLNHPNPTARRLVHTQVLSRSTEALPCIRDLFADAAPGWKIMAARVLGAAGDCTGADTLIEELTRSETAEPALQHAVYEALGSMPTPQARACLLQGLQTEDRLLLLVIARALDRMCCSDVTDAVRDFLAAHPGRSDAVLQAIASAGATELFEGLYSDPKTGERLIDCITALNDSDGIADFYIRLQFIPGDRSERDAERLEHCIIQDTERTILALDNSAAMLQFYRTVAADIGVEIITMNSVSEALRYLEQGRKVDMILLSLDMPSMDGMEFSRMVRSRLSLHCIPILLTATGCDEALDIQNLVGGPIAVVPKPFTHETLKKAVHNLLIADTALS